MKKRGIVLTPEDFIGTDWLDRMKRLKLNTLGIHSGGGEAHDVLKRLGITASSEFRKPFLDAGIQVEYEFHASASLLPESLFDSHPEYFAVDPATGERGKGRNWCISNPDVAEILRENAARLTWQLPSSTHRYYYWGADSRDAACHCPECQKLSASDLCLKSINAIADGVRRADPSGKTAYLAYLDTYSAPQNVTPADGVFLEFAPYVRSYQDAFNNPDSEVNRPFNRFFKELLNVFDPKDTMILEYYLDSSLFSKYSKPAVKPVFNEDVLKQDLDYYRSCGVAGITTFGVYMDGDYFSRYGESELFQYADAVNARF